MAGIPVADEVKLVFPGVVHPGHIRVVSDILLPRAVHVHDVDLVVVRFGVFTDVVGDLPGDGIGFFSTRKAEYPCKGNPEKDPAESLLFQN